MIPIFNQVLVIINCLTEPPPKTDNPSLERSLCVFGLVLLSKICRARNVLLLRYMYCCTCKGCRVMLSGFSGSF